MPGACLTSIKIKSLIALIISVSLHFQQLPALPKHFNGVLAELWACEEETSGRVIKGGRKQRCKPAFSGERVQMNIQRSKMEQLQDSESAPVTNTHLPAFSILVNEIMRRAYDGVAVWAERVKTPSENPGGT